MSPASGHLVIVSGLSGSGKTVALRTLEDLGFYCIDNLPAMLLPSLVSDMDSGDTRRQRIAVSIDVRNLTSDLGLIGTPLSDAGTRCRWTGCPCPTPSPLNANCCGLWRLWPTTSSTPAR